MVRHRGGCEEIRSKVQTHVSDEISLVAGVEGRYATALFDLARDSQGLDAVAQDLQGLMDMLDQSEDLRRLVRSPIFNSDTQGNAMAAIMTRAECDDLTKKFVGVVIRNRRLFVLRDMISAFGILLARHRGEVTAKVTTARALTEPQLAQLKQALKAAVGSDVQIDTEVDRDLLGGLVVRLGSRMIDTSLATKLTNLQLAMKEA